MFAESCRSGADIDAFVDFMDAGDRTQFDHLRADVGEKASVGGAATG